MTHRPVLLCTLFVVLLYSLPRVLLGPDSYFFTHDFLDSEVPARVALAGSGAAFDNGAIVSQMLGGIPRAFMPSGYNILMWLFLVFDPFIAVVINELIVRVVAFWGMYLLLDRHLTPHKLISLGVSLCFAALPFYTIYGLSIAGQPLLYYAFLNFWKEERPLRSYAILLFFALYSSLVFVGVFVLGLLAVVLAAASARERRLPGMAISGYAVLVLAWLLVDGHIIRAMFFSDLVSHRSLWHNSASDIASATLRKALEQAFRVTVRGHYHASSVQGPLALAVAAALALAGAIGVRRDAQQMGWVRVSLGLIAGIFLVLVFLYSAPGLRLHNHFLPAFQFDRVYWLVPALWYVALAAALALLAGVRWGKLVVGLVIVGQLAYILDRSPEFEKNYQLVGAKLSGSTPEMVTWKRYYAGNLYQRIGERIGRPKSEYRVATVGMSPNTAVMNGFYTVDGYSNNYLLSHKLAFRKIIANELEKNERWRMYFDEWGNRCYVFAAELGGFDVRKADAAVVRSLDLDTDALAALGGAYVLSAARIENAAENRLELLGTFETEESLWKVYLYEVP